MEKSHIEGFWGYETTRALVGLGKSAPCPPFIHQNSTPLLKACISIVRRTTVQHSLYVQHKLNLTIQRNQFFRYFSRRHRNELRAYNTTPQSSPVPHHDLTTSRPSPWGVGIRLHTFRPIQRMLIIVYMHQRPPSVMHSLSQGLAQQSKLLWKRARWTTKVPKVTLICPVYLTFQSTVGFKAMLGVIDDANMVRLMSIMSVFFFIDQYV